MEVLYGDGKSAVHFHSGHSNFAHASYYSEIPPDA